MTMLVFVEAVIAVLLFLVGGALGRWSAGREVDWWVGEWAKEYNRAEEARAKLAKVEEDLLGKGKTLDASEATVMELARENAALREALGSLERPLLSLREVGSSVAALLRQQNKRLAETSQRLRAAVNPTAPPESTAANPAESDAAPSADVVPGV